MPDDDFLQGTEAVSRAFHKYLLGHPIQIEIFEDPESAEKRAVIRLGNYVINFEGEWVEGGGPLLFRAKDVSDAR